MGEVRGGAGGWARVKSGFVFPILTTDEHRDLAMRYSAIYTKTAEEFARDFFLSGVEARPSLLSGTRRVVDVIFSFTNRNTDFTEKFSVRVDVTEEFPFLVTRLSPYYDR